MFGVAAKYISMCGLTLVSVVASSSLIAGIVVIFLTVRAFRSAYWPFIRRLRALARDGSVAEAAGFAQGSMS